MTRRSTSFAVVAVAVLACVLLAAQSASSPARPAVVSVSTPAAGLPAQAVVNIDSVNLGNLLVGPASPLVIYTVPSDRCFLVTDYELASPASPHLVEISGTSVTVKRAYAWDFDPSEDGYHSSTGLAFAPGSQVALQAQSQNPEAVAFTLSGYLTRP